MKSLTLALALSVSAAAVQAATFTETLDFANQASTGAPIDAFADPFDFSDVGINSVSGSLSASCSPFADPSCRQGDFADAFSVSIGPNRTIGLATFTVSNAQSSFAGNGNSNPDGISFQVTQTVAPAEWATNTINGNGAGGLLVTNVPVIDIVTFSIDVVNGVFPSDFVSADWRLDFQVIDTTPASVPLPASAVLLLGGLLGLRGLRRVTS